jgi:hypothetical protein
MQIFRSSELQDITVPPTACKRSFAALGKIGEVINEGLNCGGLGDDKLRR